MVSAWREGQLKAIGGVLAVIALGLVVAVAVIATSRHQLQGSSVLLNAEPAWYPSQLRKAHGQMLAEEEESEDLNDEEEAEDEEEEEEGGRALSDLVPAEVDPDDQYWPYNHAFRPTHSARFDEYGRLMRSGNCRLNMFTQKYKREDYGFPQNVNCRHGPPGAHARVPGVHKAQKWGYKCHANGKCELFPVDEDDEQYADQRASDGIARD